MAQAGPPGAHETDPRVARRSRVSYEARVPRGPARSERE